MVVSSKLLFLLLPFLFLTGCIGNAETGSVGGEGQLAAQAGDVVKVDYVGLLQDGTVFDTSIQSVSQQAGLPLRSSYEPLEFTVGAGQMIPGFDAGVVGMKAGEEKNITIPPEQAYGEWSADNVREIPRQNIQGELQVGSVIQGAGASGKVLEINESVVKVDFNHKLAGKTLIFRITMREVKPESRAR